MSLTGLAPEVTYYVRAYATNSYGTGYGATVSFTTLSAYGGIIAYPVEDETGAVWVDLDTVLVDGLGGLMDFGENDPSVVLSGSVENLGWNDGAVELDISSVFEEGLIILFLRTSRIIRRCL